MLPKIEKDNLDNQVSEAVSLYWATRKIQSEKQARFGRQDQGARSAVTGGAQMSIRLFSHYIKLAGVEEQHIFYQKALELPGYFRPTKEWDLLVIKNGELLLCLEAKSQVGPSFGNNFNNRTEEAMGSALDLWTAFREGAFNKDGQQPFLGYLFLLEDSAQSRSTVKVKEPHFKVFPEFKNASYMKRYELFCRRLVRERHYTASAFITSTLTRGYSGEYDEPAKDLTMIEFVKTMMGRILPS